MGILSASAAAHGGHTRGGGGAGAGYGAIYTDSKEQHLKFLGVE